MKKAFLLGYVLGVISAPIGWFLAALAAGDGEPDWGLS